ncbi:hypothetical protein EPUS_02320 [Endocarpon pusillum Z07020]|uniref:Uncharacterized protein n=1 Tax=Endocarpon pusillum (strain Z07020 / HMAS-L-300199) TaxID=1263415 RepID=U1GXD3_ENDPU|nr:uncharacterized protein EPUS_02320 [Endocarpon pusillum Z07020]ERF76781.1 hypothetical protein EPUS_02320 [Endocarpon pusillum Z07020]
MDIHIWPNNIRNLKWPNDGITYSYEHRGYMAPEKIEHWLLKAFGDGNGKYVLFNERIYIKAPRKPTSVSQSLAVNIPPSLLDLSSNPLVDVHSTLPSTRTPRPDYPPT